MKEILGTCKKFKFLVFAHILSFLYSRDISLYRYTKEGREPRSMFLIQHLVLVAAFLLHTCKKSIILPVKKVSGYLVVCC